MPQLPGRQVETARLVAPAALAVTVAKEAGYSVPAVMAASAASEVLAAMAAAAPLEPRQRSQAESAAPVVTAAQVQPVELAESAVTPVAAASWCSSELMASTVLAARAELAETPGHPAMAVRAEPEISALR
jgi:hypothetical protein